MFRPKSGGSGDEGAAPDGDPQSDSDGAAADGESPRSDSDAAVADSEGPGSDGQCSDGEAERGDPSLSLCGICKKETRGKWIRCESDQCKQWFHHTCLGIDGRTKVGKAVLATEYYCKACENNRKG